MTVPDLHHKSQPGQIPEGDMDTSDPEVQRRDTRHPSIPSGLSCGVLDPGRAEPPDRRHTHPEPIPLSVRWDLS